MRLARVCSLLLVALGLRLPSGFATGGTNPPDAWYEAPLAETIQLRRSGDLEGAEVQARQLLAEVEAREGAVSIATARVLTTLIAVLNARGKAPEAETLELAERALRLRREVFGEEAVEVAVALIDLGNLHYQRSDYETALELADQAVALRERHLDPSDVLLADALNNRGAYRGANGNG